MWRSGNLNVLLDNETSAVTVVLKCKVKVIASRSPINKTCRFK